ncbi:MAG: sulfatase [Bacteroidales bacterium]
MIPQPFAPAALSISATIIVLACAGSEKLSGQVQPKPNVLFIVMDDLRTELGCYGSVMVKSPNIDRLANQGVMFNRAYCQQAICMASRASLFTGLMPTKNHIYTSLSVDSLMPKVLTLNKYFSQNDYNVAGIGKLYHYKEDHIKQFGETWLEDEPGSRETGRGYLTPEAISQIENEKGPAWEIADVMDNEYRDGFYAEWAVQKLGELKQTNQPFFLGIGFRKPHLPFCAPKKYWDLYPHDSIILAENPFYPENGSVHGWNNSVELRTYTNIPDGNEPISDETSRMLIHGYYACVSYVDAQVGIVLNALDSLGLAQNTIVVLLGDNGWKLGEHGMWGKHTNFELDTNVPLIIRAPGMANGKQSASFVQVLDIYPTLCSLCELNIPENIDGINLIPVLQNPSKAVRNEAFSLWPSNETIDTDSIHVILGFSIRTNDFRYIEWTHLASGKVVSRELYDHRNDPGENKNVSKLQQYRKTLRQLSTRLEFILSSQPKNQ